jgi:hypothetical protein
MDLADVAAHLEIQQVLYRYCRAVDRGDGADVESYFMALHPAPDGAHIPANGRYLDRFARRDCRWAIPWTPWGSNSDYPQGGRRERDPSHRG